MFIKKVGYLLFVRLKLFRILALLSPIAMFFSLFSMFFILGLKEEYKFQEPSLKTKIFDVSPAFSSHEISYLSIFDGVKIAKIDGSLNNQCFLVTFPYVLEDSQQIKTIYNTISHQPHISKNVVLLSYHNQTQLNRFFQWYYDSKVNKQISFGIIRAAINLEIKRDPSQQKDKAYLKTYTSTLHADLDFFQACKELLQKMTLQWSPCQQIHRWPILKATRQGLSNLQQFLLKEKQLRIFYDHLLCELSEHLKYKQSAHEIMMKNGFQAATIKFIVSSSQQKAQKFVVSLVNEFGMQQDHLHSANTLYYPISKTHFAPLLLFLTPSLIFFTALVFYLLNSYTTKDYKENVNLGYCLPLMAYVMLSEYTITNDYTFSMYFAGCLLILSIGKDIIIVFKKSNNQMRHCQIALLAFSGLISIYFGVFCCALSHLTIILTIIMLLKPKNIILKLATKIALIILSLLWLSSHFWQQLLEVSVQLKLCMIMFVIYLSL